jgi:predicted nucleotidyltransferase
MPVWIKYIIPEDGDDFDHPNIFKIEDKSEYKVSEITKVTVPFSCSSGCV